ncbi:MAG: flippase [Bacteroidia bacterium]|nr:flippase [Bacteroidia bacterium]
MRLIPAHIRTTLRSEGFQQYVRNTGWMLGGKAIQMSLTFWITAWVGRYLGPELYGKWNYAQSVGTLFLILATVGLETVVTRNIIQHPESRSRVIGSAIVIRLLATFFSLVLLGITVMTVPQDILTSQLTLLVVISSIFQALDVFEWFFQSQVEARYSVQVRFVSVLLFAGLQLALILNGASLVAFGLAFFVKNVLTGLGLALVYGFRIENLRQLRFSRAEVRALLLDAWPIAIADIVIILYLKMDQLMIRWLMDETAVGHYSSALRFSEIWYFVAPLVMQALYPAVVKARNESRERYKRRMQLVMQVMVAVGFLIALPTAFLGPWVLEQPLFFGPAFAPAGGVLVIHVWTLLFVMMGTAASRSLVLEQMQHVILYRALTGTLLNFGLNLFLIPRYGIEGAAIASLIAQMVTSWLGYAFFPRTLPLFKMQTKALLMMGWGLRK